ncbi:MAG: TRAP transporter substrate-binding protein DctP [Thermodesulfobacteriota bacterium]|nr:TRAP transporter substrate-binding protein DctP [Thermodesulfobacteriota bacterium]
MKKRIMMLFLVAVFVGGLVFVDSAYQTAQAQPKVINWTGQSCLPPGMPVSVALADLSERVKKASGGRFILTAKPAGSVCPATKEWIAINKGVLDFAATGGSYMVPEVPFGSIIAQRVGAKLSPLGHMMWFETEGRELVNKWYKQMGYKFMNIGGFHGLPEGWIHLKKPLKGPADLKGLKMRASGDGGIVLSRMGVGTVFMPLGEIFENMKRGIIDAFECSCPSFDYTMKLYEASKYYYLSPTRAPWEMYEIQVSREKFEALPEDLKAIFLNCLKGTEIEYHAKLVADNAKAVQGFKDKGVIVENLPSSIDDAFVAEATKYLKEVAAKHESMNEVLTSQLKFEEMWKNLYGLPSPGK